MRCAGGKDEESATDVPDPGPDALLKNLRSSPSKGDSTRKHCAPLIRRMVRSTEVQRWELSVRCRPSGVILSGGGSSLRERLRSRRTLSDAMPVSRLGLLLPLSAPAHEVQISYEGSFDSATVSRSETVAALRMTDLYFSQAASVCGGVGAHVFVDHATLHDEVHMLERTDVSQGVRGDGDNVGILAGFDRAHILGASDEVGSA